MASWIAAAGISILPVPPIPPLISWMGQAGSWMCRSRPGSRLGLFDNLPIDEQRIHLPPGGTLLLYSDGVSETKDIQGTDFAPDLLYQSMAANRTRPAQEICEQLWLDVQAHGQGLPQQDDFTSVVVKRLVDESGNETTCRSGI